jgi:hypothetical protein
MAIGLTKLRTEVIHSNHKLKKKEKRREGKGREGKRDREIERALEETQKTAATHTHTESKR